MSKVSVSARIRGVDAPSNSGSANNKESTIRQVDNTRLCVNTMNADNSNSSEEPENQTGLTFELDHIFGDSCSQVELFDELVKPIISDALTGFNATIFTYGQTGSGKVFLAIEQLAFYHSKFQFICIDTYNGRKIYPNWRYERNYTAHS